MCRRQIRVRLDTETQCIPCRPAASGVFKHTHIVKSRLTCRKIRVLPQRFQLDCAFVPTDRAVRKVNAGIIIRAAMGTRVRDTAIGTGHIVYLFHRFTLLHPAFHNLHTLQPAGLWVTQRPDQDLRSNTFGRHIKHPAHRHSDTIGFSSPVVVLQNTLIEVVATEHT